MTNESSSQISFELFGYTFRNQSLLTEALTHSSVTKAREKEINDNERMEFLGDAVLQLVLSDYLYRTFPDEFEGVLTTMRAGLVNRKKLGELAAKIGLHIDLVLGPTENNPEGRTRVSTLGNALESVIGAIYLDSGIQAAESFVMSLFSEELPLLGQFADESNPKGLLQERIQALSGETPSYMIVSESGQDHDKSFISKVVWEGKEWGSGEGKSKKNAETAAARDALDRLNTLENKTTNMKED